MNIVLKSKQIYENEIEEQKIEQEGKVTRNDNNIIIEFIEKIEKEKIPYKITISPNTVIYKRGANTIYLSKNKQIKNKYNTQYGYLYMNMTLNKLQIVENYKKIELEYETEIEDTVKYQNIITIEVR